MFRFFYLLLVVLSYFTGSLSVDLTDLPARIEPCYGGDSTTGWYDLGYIEPDSLTMFFTPSRPGRRRTKVSENGVVLDPHYAFSDNMFTVHEVTEKDDGQFHVLLGGVLTHILTLMIRDCHGGTLELLYGDTCNFILESSAYSLEFTPEWYSEEPAVLLWNRTGNPQAVGGFRGRLVDKREWMIEHVTQEHAGYYTFRDKNQKFFRRRKMEVEARRLYFHRDSGEEFELEVEMDPNTMDLRYTRYDGFTECPLKSNGRMIPGWESVFGRRIIIDEDTIVITDLQPCDAGFFEIRDQRGNLALWAELVIPGCEEFPYENAIGVAVAVLLVLVVCCLCVRKYKKKNSRKTGENSVPHYEGAAEAVSFTDDTTQPPTSADPSSSHGPPPYSTTLLCPTLSPQQPGSTDDEPPNADPVFQFQAPGPAQSSQASAPEYQPLFQAPGPVQSGPEYQPLFQAPGPVQSSPVSGLPVFNHPATHF